MGRAVIRCGLAACGLVVVATVVLLGVRLGASPSTTVHCGKDYQEVDCTHDTLLPSLVTRQALIAEITVSVCAVAIGAALLDAQRR